MPSGPGLVARLPRLFTRAAFAALGARELRIRLGDFTLRVHDLGPRDAEPWVLLHGLAATAASWLPLLPHLRRSARLLLPELSEVGGTEGPRPALAVADGAEVVHQLIERLLPESAVTLGGTSLGGWTAIQLALLHPERVARLVLLAPGGFRDQDWERVARAVRVEGTADVPHTLAALFSRPPWPLARFPGPVAALYGTPAVRHLLGALREEDAFGPAELARLSMPTALLWGEGDGIFDIAVGEAMAAALPDATLYRFARAAHLPHWEARGEVTAALVDFRARRPLAPAPVSTEGATGGG